MPTGITIGNLIDATRSHVLGRTRCQLNLLHADLAADATELTLARDGSRIRAGDYLSIGEEVVLVWENGAEQRSILRGQLGTTPAAHAAGALVEIESRAPRGVILQRLVDQLRAWPADVYGVTTVTAAAGGDVDAVDLALAAGVEVHRLLEVQRSPTGDEEGWVKVEARLRRDQTSTSGYRVALLHELGEDLDLRITVATVVQVPAGVDAATDLEDLGMSARMADIPPLGAAGVMTVAGEVQRTDTVALGTSATAEQVPPGHHIRAGSSLLDLRDDRFAEERTWLLARYPYGRTT